MRTRLLGYRSLLGRHLFVVKGDLVRLLGDLWPGGRRVDVGVGDRLALDAHLFTLHRHRLLHVLGDHILAKPGAATLAAGLTDSQLLLAGHRLIGGRAAVSRPTASRSKRRPPP
jgi:hypothetical protein